SAGAGLGEAEDALAAVVLDRLPAEQRAALVHRADVARFLRDVCHLRTIDLERADLRRVKPDHPARVGIDEAEQMARERLFVAPPQRLDGVLIRHAPGR